MRDFDVTIGTGLSDMGYPRPVGLNARERSQHTYIIGKSGVGKSTLIANMVFQHLQCDGGLTVIDPHGDLVQALLALVPKRRTQDVVFFNPHDNSHSPALNILQDVPADRR